MPIAKPATKSQNMPEPSHSIKPRMAPAMRPGTSEEDFGLNDRMCW